MIEGPTTIGRENRIFQFASIGAAPQDLKYRGEPTRLEIGDRNTFRENCTINRGTTKDQLVTRIASDNLFMAGSHVGHDCVIGSHCVFANYATLGGHVEMGDWVHMGGFSGVHQFCKVGAHAFIANNTAVTRDVPPFVMAVGRPAEPHSVNSEGLKRRGYTAEQIRNIRDAYRILYRSQLKLHEATEQLVQRAAAQPELEPLVDVPHRFHAAAGAGRNRALSGSGQLDAPSHRPRRRRNLGRQPRRTADRSAARSPAGRAVRRHRRAAHDRGRLRSLGARRGSRRDGPVRDPAAPAAPAAHPPQLARARAGSSGPTSTSASTPRNSTCGSRRA